MVSLTWWSVNSDLMTIVEVNYSLVIYSPLRLCLRPPSPGVTVLSEH